jgi:predicted nucleic acid-binding protein
LNLIIDCSIAVAWLMPDEAAPAADAAVGRAVQDGADIPALFMLEVANVLLTNARRGRITQAAAILGLVDLRRLDLRQDVAAFDERLDEVVALSQQFGLTAYGAGYLELALRLGSTLATLDVPLANAARIAGVPLFGP